MPSQPATQIELNTPVQFLKGCGPERAAKLAKLGLTTAKDLLFFFPRTYDDLSDVRTVEQFEEGPLLTTVAVVEEVDFRDRPGGGCVVGMLLRQDQNFLRAIWFNLPFIKDKYRVGQRLMLSGRARLKGRW